nr:4290_t:CDS:2 [Entrophospora candida]
MAKKFHEACKKAGYNFHPKYLREWLHKQASWQIHAPKPQYIPYASFNNITIPNEALQADVLYTPYDKIGEITYLFCLTVIDIASRLKWAVPIGTTLDTEADDFSLEGILTSAGDCKRLFLKHGVKIQRANSKRTMGIVERFNRTLSERLFHIQYAEELLLPLPDRSRAWVKNLPIIINDLNNSVTSLTGIAPAVAFKMKKVYARPSWPARRPIGYNEPLLPSYTEVRHLLEPGELEGRKKRATDCIWSPEVFTIESYLVQEGQPVLYKLYNGPKRSFVREELQIVPPDTMLPPEYILRR